MKIKHIRVSRRTQTSTSLWFEWGDVGFYISYLYLEWYDLREYYIRITRRTIAVSLKHQKIITFTRQCCDIMICKLWHQDSWRFDIRCFKSWWWHHGMVTSWVQRHNDTKPHFDKISLLLSQTIGSPSPTIDCSKLNHITIILWTMQWCGRNVLLPGTETKESPDVILQYFWFTLVTKWVSVDTTSNFEARGKKTLF